MLKVGVVGTGFWSDNHLKAWSRIPEIKIAALCNRSPEKMMAKAERYGVPQSNCYTSLEEMLEKANIDAVDLITPPESHLPLVRQAAEAGKHIMCQKPFAPTLAEAQEIVETAERCGVRLMVTENWRWLEPVQTIKQVLDSGRLGKIRVARFIHSDFFTENMSADRKLPQPFLTSMPKLMFYEMGVHWFDTWRFLFGNPRRLYAAVGSFSPNVIGEDAGVITLEHDGFIGLMDMCWVSRREWNRPKREEEVHAHFVEHFVIDGEKATLKMFGPQCGISLIDNEGRETVIAARTSLDHEESHYRLQKHFVECLMNGPPIPDERSG